MDGWSQYRHPDPCWAGLAGWLAGPEERIAEQSKAEQRAKDLTPYRLSCSIDNRSGGERGGGVLPYGWIIELLTMTSIPMTSEEAKQVGK